MICRWCRDSGEFTRHIGDGPGLPTSHFAKRTSMDYSHANGIETVPCPFCAKGEHLLEIDARVRPPVRQEPTYEQIHGVPTPGGGVIYYEPFWRST